MISFINKKDKIDYLFYHIQYYLIIMMIPEIPKKINIQQFNGNFLLFYLLRVHRRLLLKINYIFQYYTGFLGLVPRYPKVF